MSEQKFLQINEDGVYENKPVLGMEFEVLAHQYILRQLERITKKLQILEDRQRDIDRQTAENTKE